MRHLPVLLSIQFRAIDTFHEFVKGAPNDPTGVPG